MADHAERLAALSPAKRTLLMRRLAALVDADAGPTRLPRYDGVNVFRASFAQERLWFLEQLAPGRAVANVVGAFRLVGAIDDAALRRSIAWLVARHESLRTTFVAVDGRPLQVISPEPAVSVTITDLRIAGDPETREHDAHRALARAAGRAFDVARGPLVRLAIYIVADDVHLVALCMHHLVADARSVDVLIRELTTLYPEAMRGTAESLPPPRLQYADYAEWQRDRYDERRAVALAEYWRSRLRGAPYPRVSAYDRTSWHNVHCARDVAPALVAGIRALAGRERVTVFVLVLAAWKAVLARRLGHGDVTVLAPVANRDRTAIAEVVGFFVNLVALRTNLDDDPSFRAALARTNDTVREALRHQEMPFERVVDVLGAERSVTRRPVSPIGFALERAIASSIDLPGIEVSAVPIDLATSRAELALIVGEDAGALVLRLEYDPAAHAASAAEAILDAVVGVLECGVAEPGRRLSELGAAGQEGDASRGDATGRSLWERFMAHVGRTPHAVAVSADGASVGYGELAERAAAVADELARRGAGRDAIVAVWGHRNVDWVAEMLGIWCRGAAYLPLDPRWPAARIAQVLRRSRASLVLCAVEPPLELTSAAAEASCTVVAFVPPSTRGRASLDAPVPAQGDVAYVVYTSGSTGVPKGAVIEHAGMLNHLDAKVALLGLGPKDCVGQTAAAGFDISLWQCLAALVVGGSVAIVGDEAVRDPAALRTAIAAQRATVVELVPALLEALLELDDRHAGAVEPLGSLRWVVATGEALAPELCRRWLRRHPDIPLVNAYGPTECADDVTHHVIASPPPVGAIRVPIGRPIPGIAIRVLDEQLRPVPDGACGELCVAGVGVGRGYLHDREQTARAFLTPDPCTREPGSRLYRTGDRGLANPDGTFEWLGRLDGQVKIRGMRIETDEVEAVLAAHPSIRQVAVLAEPPDASTHLIAFVAVASCEPPTAEDLRDFALTRVPEVMVPAAFVVVDSLPQTLNGKIDRQALSKWTPRSSPACERRQAPTSRVERLLAALWHEILGVEACSVDDGFFALGGDSLSAIRLVAAARRHGVALTVEQVFAHPTIGALATAATTAPIVSADQGIVVGEVPLLPLQRLFLAADLPDRDHYNMAMLVTLEASPSRTALAIAVEHLMRHHDALRLRVRRDGRAWRATIAGLEGPVPYAHVDLSALSDVEAAATIEAAAAEAHTTLDLASGPILRVLSFDLGATRPGRLLLVVHHVACDAASWPILLEDLAAVYAQLRRGDPIALPPKTTSIQAWARRLDEYVRAPEHAGDGAFWRRACAESGARLPRMGAAAPRVSDVACRSMAWDAAETAALTRVSAAAGATIESVLLAALALAVTEPTRADRLLVYLERHGRMPLGPDIDVSRTVGWFTAVFPVALRVPNSRTAWGTLVEIERVLADVPNGGVGWPAVAYADEAVRGDTMTYLPRGLPEISVNFLGRVDPPRALGFAIAPESPGREYGRRGTRPTVLDLVARLAEDRLIVDWHFDAVLLAPGVIDECADRFGASLRELVRGAGSGELASEERRPT